MKQYQFERDHGELWQTFEALLDRPKTHPAELPQQYRRVCQSLALALQRGYSPALTDYLQHLVQRGHQALYGRSARRPLQFSQWLLQEFPQRVREEWRLLLFALITFWGVALLCGLIVWFHPQMADSFIGTDEVAKMRSMYSGSRLARGREDSGDFYMFAFYIWNNVSICFRTFAGGVLGGVPAAISLAINGVMLGTVSAVLVADPATRLNFLSFVITHASVEITGLVLAGVAGMRLGLSLLRPGRLTRRLALQQAARRVFPILLGASTFTLLAAFIEGFWSASPSVAPEVRLGVGAAAWVAVIAYLSLAGRRSS